MKKKYGSIENGIWSNEAKFCRFVQIPDEIGGSWINSLTNHYVEHIYCNVDMADALLEALENVRDANLLKELKTFDGCFHVRDQRGCPGVCSAHSYALAIDINASENEMGHPTSFSPEFIKCWTDAGFKWGGSFKRVDPMHFSWVGW